MNNMIFSAENKLLYVKEPMPDNGKQALQWKRELEKSFDDLSTALGPYHMQENAHHETSEFNVDHNASELVSKQLRERFPVQLKQSDTLFSPTQKNQNSDLSIGKATPHVIIPSFTHVISQYQVNSRASVSTSAAQTVIFKQFRQLQHQYPETNMSITQNEQGLTLWIRDFQENMQQDLNDVIQLVKNFCAKQGLVVNQVIVNGQPFKE